MEDSKIAAIIYENPKILEWFICNHCSHRMFFDPTIGTPPKLGQVYSQAGIREIRITGLCETCFDDITMPPDEDYEPDDSHARMEDAYNDEHRFSDLLDDRVPDEHSEDL